MRIVILALAVLTACSTTSPRDRYVQALNYRLEGNSEAYYDTLIAIAQDAPTPGPVVERGPPCRGSDLATTASVIGILSAIAVPNFMKFQARSRQSEAKSNLRMLLTAMRAKQMSSQRYPTRFKDLDFAPAPGARYLYFIGPQEYVGGGGATDVELLMQRAETTFASMGIKPSVGKNKFLAVAVGDPDDDGALDVWSIDEQGNLVNLLNDLE